MPVKRQGTVNLLEASCGPCKASHNTCSGYQDGQCSRCRRLSAGGRECVCNYGLLVDGRMSDRIKLERNIVLDMVADTQKNCAELTGASVVVVVGGWTPERVSQLESKRDIKMLNKYLLEIRRVAAKLTHSRGPRNALPPSSPGPLEGVWTRTIADSPENMFSSISNIIPTPISPATAFAFDPPSSTMTPVTTDRTGVGNSDHVEGDRYSNTMYQGHQSPGSDGTLWSSSHIPANGAALRNAAPMRTIAHGPGDMFHVLPFTFAPPATTIPILTDSAGVVSNHIGGGHSHNVVFQGNQSPGFNGNAGATGFSSHIPAGAPRHSVWSPSHYGPSSAGQHVPPTGQYTQNVRYSSYFSGFGTIDPNSSAAGAHAQGSNRRPYNESGGQYNSRP